jgi:hypothetical protein
MAHQMATQFRGGHIVASAAVIRAWLQRMANLCSTGQADAHLIHRCRQPSHFITQLPSHKRAMLTIERFISYHDSSTGESSSCGPPVGSAVLRLARSSVCGKYDTRKYDKEFHYMQSGPCNDLHEGKNKEMKRVRGSNNRNHDPAPCSCSMAPLFQKHGNL